MGMSGTRGKGVPHAGVLARWLDFLSARSPYPCWDARSLELPSHLCCGSIPKPSAGVHTHYVSSLRYVFTADPSSLVVALIPYRALLRGFWDLRNTQKGRAGLSGPWQKQFSLPAASSQQICLCRSPISLQPLGGLFQTSSGLN